MNLSRHAAGPGCHGHPDMFSASMVEFILWPGTNTVTHTCTGKVNESFAGSDRWLFWECRARRGEARRHSRGGNKSTGWYFKMCSVTVMFLLRQDESQKSQHQVMVNGHIDIYIYIYINIICSTGHFRDLQSLISPVVKPLFNAKWEICCKRSYFGHFGTTVH